MIALEKIPVVSVYIQPDGAIVSVVEECVALEDDGEGGSLFSKRRLIDFVSLRRIRGTGETSSLQYRLDDILLFHFVDDDTCNGGEFMHSFSVLEDIVVEESLPEFHSLSAIYLFFRDFGAIKKNPLTILPVSTSAHDHIVAMDLDPNRSTRKCQVQPKRGRIKGTKRIYIS